MINTLKELKLQTAYLTDFSNVNLLEINSSITRFLPQEQKNQLTSIQLGNKYTYVIRYTLTTEFECLIHGKMSNRNDRLYGCKSCNLKMFPKPQKEKPDHVSLMKKMMQSHKNKYEIMTFKSVKDKSKVKCMECNHIFERIFQNLSNDYRCPNCIKLQRIKSFETGASLKHDNGYSYTGDYTKNNEKVTIIHKQCGRPKRIVAFSHLRGSGCDFCPSSRHEKLMCKVLEFTTLNFQTQHNFNKHPQLRGKGTAYMSFDFYLPEYNLCVECDGEHHYKLSKHWGGVKYLEDVQRRDQIKNQFCLDNNIRLLRIPYWINPTGKLILQYLNEDFTVINASTKGIE